jgi:gliding motility-associated-like protein
VDHLLRSEDKLPLMTELIATNFISPNGDAKNDTWVIRNIEKYPENIVKIYNRQGQEVYSKKNYLNEWDGTFNGAVLKSDTYYYILSPGTGSPLKRGYISLIRE